MSKLAVIDWGIGGLGFYKEWKKHRPDDSIVYFSDSGYTPYGKLSEQVLADRLSQLFSYLSDNHGATHIMVACNAASSVLERNQGSEHYEAHGVIEPTADFIREHLKDREVSVLGGNRTIESGIFQQLLPEFALHQKAAQPLSALVERGDCYG